MRCINFYEISHMKTLTSIIAVALSSVFLSFSATAAESSATEKKHAAVFCGLSGHEDADPGYGGWLKARLDHARDAGIGDAVTLGVMATMLCESSPNGPAAGAAVAKVTPKKG